jgi:hypothetical protein
MNFSQYCEVFRDAGVRAMLNWELLTQLDCPVAESYSRSRKVLGNLFTVWYQRPDGSPGDWHGESDRPLRVREAAAAPSRISADRRQRVEEFIKTFAQDPEPVQLVLPGYTVAAKDVLILDGTHRAVAAFLAKVEVRLLIFSLAGPLDARVLPDLRRYPIRTGPV